MDSIVLATMNARYSHTSFGLRYLLANMGELTEQTRLMEFVIQDSIVDVLACILEQNPVIVGLGVYIWNVQPLTQLVADLKRLRPEVIIVLGGPEVSYETADQTIIHYADYVICGEADLAFSSLCRRILSGNPPVEKIQQAVLPQMTELQLPYGLYSADDIAHRVIYVEVSRGCPFTCEFCLSALEIPVRMVELDLFLTAMQSLLDRGARQFKFVDRTFNLNLRISREILRFFLERYQPGMFLHFEMIPDRLPESLRDLIQQFPAGSLQFEIGVQTFNEEAGRLISRQQDNLKLADNFRWLRGQTGVHIHADLIIGLPGEDWQSFASGFDHLFELRPQEIQVGILKRLRGTPIVRHDNDWQMVYSMHPPYEILNNRLLTFEQIHQLRRFARFWDLIGNSGNFGQTLRLLIPDGTSAFERMVQLSEWIYEREQRRHGIALIRLFERVFEFLTTELNIPEQQVAETLWADYSRHRRDTPAFLRRFDLKKQDVSKAVPDEPSGSRLPSRQARHNELNH
ncbi:MAG: DUF4080 domain-containing protein [Planctomycetaceae bacterium]|nr:DUF4080 domain-containing protein [Planctomycetaceae bacterium]